MCRSADRRKFLQTISLGGTGLAMLAHTAPTELLPEKPAAYQVENQFFGAFFDKSGGTLQVWRKARNAIPGERHRPYRNWHRNTYDGRPAIQPHYSSEECHRSFGLGAADSGDLY